ncbi:MAG TPA: DUF6491 family protein [Caulobacteraceae bacterium]
MQRHTPITLAPAALALAAALSVSAAAQPPPAAPAVRPSAPACFWIRDVNNFAAVDTTTLYVRVGVSQVWRLNLFADCFNLDWVHGIGLRNRGAGGSVCEGRTPGLEVVVRDVAVGRQRCPVTDVRRLTPAEIAALPKGARP